MSAGERERSLLVRQTLQHHLSQREAAERLGSGFASSSGWFGAGSGRVMRDLCRASVAGRRTGGWRGVRLRIGGLLRDKYADFGPTLAAEKLLELDGIAVSGETVRQMQIEHGAVEAEEAAGEAGVSAARPAAAVWRTDPDRRQSARLVRGPWRRAAR